MARQTTEQTPDPSDRIAAVLERLADQAPVEHIGYGHPKYQQRLRDEGFYTEFAKPVFQNGRPAAARGLKPETIERAVNLRAGTYIGGRVTVNVDAKGRVYLNYKCASVEDRMRSQQFWTDFNDLVEKIWTEMHAA